MNHLVLLLNIEIYFPLLIHIKVSSHQ